MVPHINSHPPGQNDDVVKLYDLTDLCSEIVEDRSLLHDIFHGTLYQFSSSRSQ